MTIQKLYTPEEISTILRIHIQTVWRYFRQGKLKAIKVGGNYRVREKDLEKYLDEN